MFDKQRYENSLPGGVGVLQIAPDPEQAPSEAQLFVPLRQSTLRGEIAGPVAVLQLVHTYGYTRQQCDRTLEALYRFPLPGDAAVIKVQVRFGEVEIATQLQAREEAEEAYGEAVEQGKQAALVTRESPDVFTLRIAGLQPDQEVTVETTYVQLAQAHGTSTGWTLRVPLTTAPRYVRQDELGSRYAAGQPLALLRDPGHRFTLELCGHDLDQIESPTHALACEADQACTHIHLRDKSVIPDRDFVLSWTPRQAPARPTLSAWTYDDPDSEWRYFLALVTPPVEHTVGEGLPREVILLVDHSGSMRGAKWEAADWAVHSFLSGLHERDLFDLGLFHSSTKWFAPRPRPATETQVAAAAQYLNDNRDSGGTNLGVALEQALRLGRPNGMPRARHVLIVTDAQVTDAGRILGLADREAQHERRRRISVLCIDAAPNAFLARALAERGGGVARFLTSSPDEGDITTALEEVLADWAEPVLVGLELAVDVPDGQASGRATRQQAQDTAIDLGDLPCGRAVWVAGRVPANTKRPTFVLRTAGQEIETRPEITPLRGAIGRGIKALFGARRVFGLEYAIQAGLSGQSLVEHLRHIGIDPSTVDDRGRAAIYPENARQEAREALRERLVRASLDYSLICSETAFVAVREEAGEQIEARVMVPNALPGGWSDTFLSKSMGGPVVTRDTFMAQPVALASAAAPPPRTRSAPGQAAPAPKRHDATIEVWAGRPPLRQGRAVLLDPTQSLLPDQARIVRVEIKLDPVPQAKALDRQLKIEIYVGDLAQPRAQFRLADVIRLGGSRPLNVRRERGEPVRVILLDPSGVWAHDAPRLFVSLVVS